MRIDPRGKTHPAGKDRLQRRLFPVVLRAETEAGGGARKTRRGHHVAGARLLHRAEFRAGVTPELGDLFLKPAAFDHVPHPEDPARDLQVSQTQIVFIGDLEHTGGKRLSLRRRRREFF